MRFVTRGELVNFEIFDVARDQHWAFCSFDYREFYFNVFPETNVVLLPYYQRWFDGQLRENYVPMRNALSFRPQLVNFSRSVSVCRFIHVS